MEARGTGELLSTNEAAATLTLGVDAFRNERKNSTSSLRYGTGVSIVGSAAINDCSVDIYVEDYFVGRFFNTRAGVVAAILPDDLIPVKAFAIPPGSRLVAIVTDAPATSPLLIKVYGYQR